MSCRIITADWIPPKQSDMRNKNKNLRAAAPKAKKDTGSASAAPKGIDGMQFRWSIVSTDWGIDGYPWSWNLSPMDIRELLELLNSLEPLTWREIKGMHAGSKKRNRVKHHSQSIDTLCKDARVRLGEINVGVDELFRFRHGNMTRIWGYLQEGTFYLLWFDNDHSVCPTDSD